MRKALTYLIAFVVSFMVFYSWYYYHNQRWLGMGYVANADTLRTTTMQPQPYIPSLKKNIVYSAGMLAAMAKAKISYSIGAGDAFKDVLNPNVSVTYSGPYSLEAIDELSRELVAKFPKHPPLDVQKVKKGDKILFSYVFRNVELPGAFMEYGKGMELGGKKIRAIRFTGQGDAAGSQFFLNREGRSFAFRIPINNEEEAYWFSKDSLQDVATAWLAIKNICITPNIHPISQGEETLFPELDLFLEKTYTPDEFASFFSPSVNDFKLIDDRLKLKIGALGHTLGSRGNVQARKQYIFGPSSFFCVKRKASAFPYIGIILHNGDIFSAYGK
jgi:hypothetical protein